ncbi:MAG: hypothetical protein M3131_04405 [Actinomycetota bacterium]|nr:hypothetical protein [Actinomycetota bacterium]
MSTEKSTLLNSHRCVLSWTLRTPAAPLASSPRGVREVRHDVVITASSGQAERSVRCDRGRRSAPRASRRLLPCRVAEGLRDLGCRVEPSGKEGRYFTVAGVDEETARAFRKRS